MTKTLLPTRYSTTEEIPIENRQLATKVKDQLALSIPYYTKAGEPPPVVLRLRDCVIPFPDYDESINSKHSQFRAKDVLTGATKLSRSEEHTSELQSLMRISYAVFCLKKKKKKIKHHAKLNY